MSNRPIKKFKSKGGLTVCVWENYKKDDDSFPPKPAFHTLTVEKIFKSGEEFKHTNSFRSEDIPRIMTLLQEAYKFTIEFKTISPQQNQKGAQS
jgi:hypothetical protein